ncbi:sigma 54-interacting response regulator [Chitinophaga sp. YIM B06452]|uniref:sigma 54-interacting response regulator n=1 Tax=Chitinophaga sp. YIM B06452 TaxID=3082158 RepID=UPI0031FE4731
MREKILIVEDELIVATDLRLLLEKHGFSVCGVARSYHKAMEIIESSRPDMVLIDIFLSGTYTGIDLARKLKKENIAFIYLSANSGEDILNAAKKTQPYGFLVKPFREKDLLAAIEIARFSHEHSHETQLFKENIFRSKTAAIAGERASWQDKLQKVCNVLQPVIPYDLITWCTETAWLPNQCISFYRMGYEEYQAIGMEELLRITGRNVEELAALHAAMPVETMPVVYDEAAFRQLNQQPSIKSLLAKTFQLQSHLALPLQLPGGETVSLCLYSKRPDAYSFKHIAVFNRLQPFLLQFVKQMQEEEGSRLAPQSSAPPLHAADGRDFEGIIGNSHLLLNVFDLIAQVAPFETSVLITGESGTGKEKIVDCIHRRSKRKHKPLVKLNCAALPVTLIESALFGHEKGAFTGANEKRTGKFEQADGGTIFLDEIGEIPLELQGKLLRVLQEKEIDRIGGREPVKIDVRIIAATNRNLEKEVAEGRFRLDLYYRLNIFPIDIPPLRERKEDIPALVDHFIQSFNKKTGKQVSGVTDKVMKAFEAYHWPGNIRELEHLVERGMLLSRGSYIDDVAMPAAARGQAPAQEESRVKTMQENERDHIIAVLRKCKGRIWGAGGAAELLNLPPTTLNSRIKKLGIQRELYT